MALWRSLGRAAPAYSPRKTLHSQCAYAQMHSATPPTPFSASPSTSLGSPQINAQAQSELTRPDNRTSSENMLKAIPTHGGIEMQHTASRPVWRYAANSRRELNARHPNRNAERGVNQTPDIPIETHSRGANRRNKTGFSRALTFRLPIHKR